MNKASPPRVVYGELFTPRLETCFASDEASPGSIVQERKSIGRYVAGKLTLTGRPVSDNYNWWIPVDTEDGASVWVMYDSVRRMKQESVRTHNNFGCPVWKYTWT